MFSRLVTQTNVAMALHNPFSAALSKLLVFVLYVRMLRHVHMLITSAFINLLWYCTRSHVDMFYQTSPCIRYNISLIFRFAIDFLRVRTRRHVHMQMFRASTKSYWYCIVLMYICFNRLPVTLCCCLCFIRELLTFVVFFFMRTSCGIITYAATFSVSLLLWRFVAACLFHTATRTFFSST